MANHEPSGGPRELSGGPSRQLTRRSPWPSPIPLSSPFFPLLRLLATPGLFAKGSGVVRVTVTLRWYMGQDLVGVHREDPKAYVGLSRWQGTEPHQGICGWTVWCCERPGPTLVPGCVCCRFQ